LREGLLIVFLDFLVNFLAMNRHVQGGDDAEFDYFAIHPDHFDNDPSVYDDALVKFAR
jgi:hypothetical protein